MSALLVGGRGPLSHSRPGTAVCRRHQGPLGSVYSSFLSIFQLDPACVRGPAFVELASPLPAYMAGVSLSWPFTSFTVLMNQSLFCCFVIEWVNVFLR